MYSLMVIMASGVRPGRVRTTMAKSRKIAVIQKVNRLIETFSLRLQHWTSLFWSINTCQIEVSADQYHVTISLAQVYSLSRSLIF